MSIPEQSTEASKPACKHSLLDTNEQEIKSLTLEKKLTESRLQKVEEDFNICQLNASNSAAVQAKGISFTNILVMSLILALFLSPVFLH